MSADSVHAEYVALTDTQKKAFQAKAGVQPLAPLTQKDNDIVWFIVVGTLAVTLIGALGALALFVYDGKRTGLFSPIVTLVLGIFGGLLAPSPTKDKGGG